MKKTKIPYSWLMKHNTFALLTIVLFSFILSCNTVKQNNASLIINEPFNDQSFWKNMDSYITNISEHEGKFYLLSSNNIYVCSQEGSIEKKISLDYDDSLELIYGEFFWDRNDLYCTFSVKDTRHSRTFCYDLLTGRCKYQLEDLDIVLNYVTDNYIVYTPSSEQRVYRCYSRENGNRLWEIYYGEYDPLSITMFEPYIINTFGVWNENMDQCAIHLSAIDIYTGKISDNIVLMESMTCYPNQVTKLLVDKNNIFCSCIGKDHTQIIQYNLNQSGKLVEQNRFILPILQPSSYPLMYPVELLFIDPEIYALSLGAVWEGSFFSFDKNQYSLYKFNTEKNKSEQKELSWIFNNKNDSNWQNSFLSESKRTLFLSYVVSNETADENGVTHLIDIDNIVQIIDVANFKTSVELSVSTDSRSLLINDDLIVCEYVRDKNAILISQISPDGSKKVLSKIHYQLEKREGKYYSEKELSEIDFYQISPSEFFVILNQKDFIKIGLENP